MFFSSHRTDALIIVERTFVFECNSAMLFAVGFLLMWALSSTTAAFDIQSVDRTPLLVRADQPAWVNKPFNQWTPADHLEHASHVGQCSWYVVSLAGSTVWSFGSSAAAALRPPLYILPCGAFAPSTLRQNGLYVDEKSLAGVSQLWLRA